MEDPISEHVAFARKYRPRTFSDVVGQEAIAKALRGAVQTGRTTSVYLFSGSHGVGKTSMARILAKALNCPESKDGNPCLTCPTCISIDRGEAMDVLEIDAASHRGIEDARQLRESVRYRAQGARFKVYILDEVHQFTKDSFDALLKTFEEAPDHVRLILATTELRKVPSTIRSRSQVFHFRRHSRDDIERRLRSITENEGVKLSEDALAMITRRARGSMRDGQKMLDQVVTLGAQDGVEMSAADAAALLGGFTPERVKTLLGSLAQGDAKALLEEVGIYFAEGGYAGTFLEELQDALRATLYLKTCGPKSELLDEANYDIEALSGVAKVLSEEGLLYALQLLAEVEQKLRIAKPREPRVLIEVALVRLARASDLRPMGEILARLERLEEALSSGAVRSDPSPGRRASAGPATTAPEARRAPAPATPRQSPSPTRRPEAPAPEPANRMAQDRSAPPPQRQRRPGSYSYPAEMGPGGRGAPNPATPSKRALVEAERSARLDGPPPASGSAGGPAAAPARTPARAPAPQSARAPAPQPARAPAPQAARAPAPQAGGAPVAVAAPTLSAANVFTVWQTLRPKLGDTDKLGMAAELLEKGEPQLRLDPDGVIRIKVGLKKLLWNQLNEPRLPARLGELFSERLGAKVGVEFEQVAPVAKGREALADGAIPVRDEPLVKHAARELDARLM